MEEIIQQAERLEENYDWLGAAGSYRKALDLLSEDNLSQRGDVTERLGYASCRAAFQSESNDEFKSRMSQAIAHYRKAEECYAKLNENSKSARILRCTGMIRYLMFWLTVDAHDKKRLLQESWTSTKESLKAFEMVGDSSEYGRTYNQLASNAIFDFTLEWDFKEREKPIAEGVEYGERAVRLLSTLKDSRERTRAYAKAITCLCVFGYYFQDGEERERCFQKGQDYWKKAKALSEETLMTEFLYPVFGSQIILGGEGSEEALANYKKSLEYGRKTKDRFITGCALDWLTYHTFWKSTGTEDPDKRAELLKEGLEYSEEAKRQFAKISYISPRADVAWIEGASGEYYFRLAETETDPKKKSCLLEKAYELGKDLAKTAEDSGYPETMMWAYSAASSLRFMSAMIETNPEEKKKLLEESLELFDRGSKILHEIEPLLYWNLGVNEGALGTMRYELAKMTTDPETKKSLLQEALSHMEDSTRLRIKELSFLETKGPHTSLFASLGESQYMYGDLSTRLYSLNSKKENLTKAIKGFEDAIKSYQKLGLTNRIAECHWRIAQVYDDLEENLEAASNFDLASDNYRHSAEKTPQLKKLYEDHVLYMQAWSEIEKARHHHAKQEYGSAEEHFQKAATLHKSLKQWSYMAPNYSAWARIEKAEEDSRKEQTETAFEEFKQASKLFSETRISLQKQLDKIEDTDEKQMATDMIKGSDLRRDYCEGRIAIEDAKILDKRGDHYSSSEKYGSAADAFEKMTHELESKQDLNELLLIIGLSRAWQKMTLAEARSSPALYQEASELFERAEELSPNERTKMLILGHSRFCKALEAGTRFSDSREPALHQTAEQHLESAASYYVKAGFQNASEYSKAMEHLFDAYLYMDDAKKEKDPEKKARLYTMAERILQTSAGSFMKAEHPEKTEQVLRLLDKAREEKELALSLSEVFHAPAIVSTTAAFVAPTPNQENAVGLERFENADVQANLIVHQKELKVGEHFSLTIELVNAGKGPALLIKLNEVIPEGFELDEEPETYSVEDSYIDMKGKRLGPLKTDELKLVLKPKVQGTFALKPTILYLDEKGKYKSHELEAVTIMVKELGIKGWLKGET